MKLKTQQAFKRERYNAFTESVKKIALSSNNDQIMQSNDSIEAYAHEPNKDLLSKKGEIEM